MFSSKIYYRGQFYSYPLKPFDALSKLGFIESGLCVLSFAKARVHPKANPKSFEDWVVNQFGRRLFNIFFKTYTEKVWGMSCQEISADWAAQRIKGLSLGSAIKNALIPQRQPKDRTQVVKTLIDTFRYPRRGPGMMWEACAERVRSLGGAVLLGRPNLHLVGRNGMHKYNNQDHAMMTALLAARNIIAGNMQYDVWAVNQDAEYHEAGEAGADPAPEMQYAGGAQSLSAFDDLRALLRLRALELAGLAAFLAFIGGFSSYTKLYVIDNDIWRHLTVACGR